MVAPVCSEVHGGPPAPYGFLLNVIILKIKTQMMSGQCLLPMSKMPKLHIWKVAGVELLSVEHGLHLIPSDL